MVHDQDLPRSKCPRFRLFFLLALWQTLRLQAQIPGYIVAQETKAVREESRTLTGRRKKGTFWLRSVKRHTFHDQEKSARCLCFFAIAT